MSQSTPSHRLAILALMGLAIIWGYNWVVMKIAVHDAPPFTFAAMRAFYGSLSLFIVMMALRKSLKPYAPLRTCLFGILQSGGTIGLATWALVNGGAGKTAILTYTMSLWTLLFAWIFLGEWLKGRQWISVGLSGLGLLFILLPFSLSSDLMSKGLAVLAGVCWALSSIVAKQLNQQAPIDVISFNAWQMLYGSVLLMVVSGVVPSSPVHWTPSFIAALIYNVIPGGAIAWLLWLYALKHLSTGTAGIGALATPVIGLLSGLLQLGEIPSLTEAIGIGCIIAALILNAMQAINAPPTAST